LRFLAFFFPPGSIGGKFGPFLVFLFTMISFSVKKRGEFPRPYPKSVRQRRKTGSPALLHQPAAFDP
jgi:hypothetical protein